MAGLRPSAGQALRRPCGDGGIQSSGSVVNVVCGGAVAARGLEVLQPALVLLFHCQLSRCGRAEVRDQKGAVGKGEELAFICTERSEDRLPQRDSPGQVSEQRLPGASIGRGVLARSGHRPGREALRSRTGSQQLLEQRRLRRNAGARSRPASRPAKTIAAEADAATMMTTTSSQKMARPRLVGRSGAVTAAVGRTVPLGPPPGAI